MRLGTSKIFVLLALGVGGEVPQFAVVIATLIAGLKRQCMCVRCAHQAYTV